MLKFKEYNTILREALITFGNKAYPKFGQVVIMSGGSASGKGFINGNLMGIEGKVLDVDKLKDLVIASKKLSAKIEKETGHDIKNMNMKDPKNVSLMHSLVNDVYGISKKTEAQLFRSIAMADKSRLPNIIFDVTLKDMKKLKNISETVIRFGQEKENIHIVWVVNDVKIAIKQNSARDRVVEQSILIDTHVGAARTMNDILNAGDSLKQYMDGDIWLAFNKEGVDSYDKKIVKHGKEYIINIPSTHYKIKEKGKKSKTLKQIDKDMYNKVKSYIPAIVDI